MSENVFEFLILFQCFTCKLLFVDYELCSEDDCRAEQNVTIRLFSMLGNSWSKHAIKTPKFVSSKLCFTCNSGIDMFGSYLNVLNLNVEK